MSTINCIFQVLFFSRSFPSYGFYFAILSFFFFPRPLLAILSFFFFPRLLLAILSFFLCSRLWQVMAWKGKNSCDMKKTLPVKSKRWYKRGTEKAKKENKKKQNLQKKREKILLSNIKVRCTIPFPRKSFRWAIISPPLGRICLSLRSYYDEPHHDETYHDEAKITPKEPSIKLVSSQAQS